MSRRNKNRPRGAQTEQGVSNAVNVADAFSNPLFHLGYGSQSPLEATEYPLTRMTDNYALLNSLYRGNWVVQNVIGLMVDDMLREWYTVKGVPPDAQTALDKLERRVGLRECLNEGLRWGLLGLSSSRGRTICRSRLTWIWSIQAVFRACTSSTGGRALHPTSA